MNNGSKNYLYFQLFSYESEFCCSIWVFPYAYKLCWHSVHTLCTKQISILRQRKKCICKNPLQNSPRTGMCWSSVKYIRFCLFCLCVCSGETIEHILAMFQHDLWFILTLILRNTEVLVIIVILNHIETKIQVFCRLLNIYRLIEKTPCLDLKGTPSPQTLDCWDKVHISHMLDNSVIIYPSTQPDSTAILNVHRYRCENLRSCISTE